MIPADSPLIEHGPIALPGVDLRYFPGWLAPPRADALLRQLQLQASWEVHVVRIFGREHPSPRLSCWMGDADAAYRYSGVRHTEAVVAGAGRGARAPAR